MFYERTSSLMMYNRLRVVQACESYLEWRKSINEKKIAALVDKYRTYRKHFKYIGRKLNDDEIYDIIDGKHMYYGLSILEQMYSFHRSLLEKIEFQGSYWSSKVEEILRCAKNAEDPNVSLTTDDFSIICKFYERTANDKD